DTLAARQTLGGMPSRWPAWRRGWSQHAGRLTTVGPAVEPPAFCDDPARCPETNREPPALAGFLLGTARNAASMPDVGWPHARDVARLPHPLPVHDGSASDRKATWCV